MSEDHIPRKLYNDIVRIAANVAVSRYREEKVTFNKKLKENKIKNTKILLQKYRSLQSFNTNAIYEAAQLSSDFLLKIMGIDTAECEDVKSIKNSVVSSKIILEHIDSMLRSYESRCSKSSKPEMARRWRVIHAMYISPEQKSMQDIADTEHISKSMAYLDLDNACADLSSLLFGLDLSDFLL